MIGQEFHEALADEARGAKNARAPLFFEALYRRVRWLFRLHVDVTLHGRL
jgi:hypothetical protein